MLPIKTLLTTLLIAGSAIALPEAVPKAAVESIVREAAPRAEPAALAKRDCECVEVSNPGLYCGYCYSDSEGGYIVTSGYVDSHVYWCNEDGGCKDFGDRDSCADYAGPCDGRDS